MESLRSSALMSNFNAEAAEIRREPLRKSDGASPVLAAQMQVDGRVKAALACRAQTVANPG